MRSMYGIPGARPRPTGGGDRAGKVAAAVFIGLLVCGFGRGLGGWGALVAVPIGIMVWRGATRR